MIYYYVSINRLRSREDYLHLSEWSHRSGTGDRFKYSKGGWEDYQATLALPHLRFEREDDAIAYVLTYGGSYSTTIPSSNMYIGS